MPAKHIASLLDLLARGTVTRTVAKQVFEESYQSGVAPERIIAEKGLTQISDTDVLSEIAQQVIANNPKAVGEYQSGKKTAIQFLVGQIMKQTKGQANPHNARAVLEAALGGETHA